MAAPPTLREVRDALTLCRMLARLFALVQAGHFSGRVLKVDLASLCIAFGVAYSIPQRAYAVTSRTQSRRSRGTCYFGGYLHQKFASKVHMYQ